MLAWPPSSDEEGTSLCACAGSGVRFLGAFIVFSPAVTAVLISRITVGGGVGAWTTGASAAVPLSGAKFARTSTGATTAPAHQTRPPAKPTRGGNPRATPG